MDALDLLLTRTSMSRLQAPAPSAEQLDIMYRAALRAPDHGQIRPWRFLTVEGQGREALGELYAQALLHQNPQASAEQIKRARAMPLRAPMVIIVIACKQEHPKVPEYEQLIAAGCAAHGLLLAAQAQGLGAFWRSGEMTDNKHVTQQLGLQENEQIIGYIYVGTPSSDCRTGAQLEPAEFVGSWPN